MTDTSNDGSSTDEQSEGEVSEMSVMGGDAEPEEIQPHDATAADPSDESGPAQEGTAGPNAAPAENRADYTQDPPRD